LLQGALRSSKELCGGTVGLGDERTLQTDYGGDGKMHFLLDNDCHRVVPDCAKTDWDPNDPGNLGLNPRIAAFIANEINYRESDFPGTLSNPEDWTGVKEKNASGTRRRPRGRSPR
jgi:hypothetical protein